MYALKAASQPFSVEDQDRWQKDGSVTGLLMAGKQRLSTSCIYIPVSKVKWVIPEGKEASLPKQYCHIGTRASGMIRRGLDLSRSLRLRAVIQAY